MYIATIRYIDTDYVILLHNEKEFREFSNLIFVDVIRGKVNYDVKLLDTKFVNLITLKELKKLCES